MRSMDCRSKPWRHGEYVYPGTDVLINVPGYRNFDALVDYEHRAVIVSGVDVHMVKGVFDKKHICAIHKHLFRDVYPWAGELRTVNIFKADGRFMDARLLGGAFRRFHGKAKADGYMKQVLDVDAAAEKLAGYFADLNAMHPFREGNGRVTRVVLCQLAYNAGYDLSYKTISQQDWTHASRCAQYGTMFPMINILSDGLVRWTSGGPEFAGD